MVMEYGMSDRLGPLQYGRPQSEVFLGRDYARSRDFSDAVAASIDEEVRKLVGAAHEEARQILREHRDALERMVEALLESETLGPDEVAVIFEDVPKWEHTAKGALRIRPPADAPADSSTGDGMAAARQTDGVLP